MTDALTWKMVNSKPYGPTVIWFQQIPGTGFLISPEHFDTAKTHPVGAGPLKHAEYEPGAIWVGERWDGYWDNQNVGPDRFEQNILSDRNTALNAFLNGDLDYLWPSGGIGPSWQAELEADGRKVYTGVHALWTNSWFNMNPSAPAEHQIFRDARMRHAVNKALDRQVINEVAFEGTGAPMRAHVSNASWALPRDKNYYGEPDRQAALQLMDAAGYGDGFTGVHLGFFTETSTIVADPAVAQLREVGMEFEQAEYDEPTTVAKLFDPQDWSFAMLPWASPFDPDPILGPVFGLYTGSMYGSPDGPAPRDPSDPVLTGLYEHVDLLADAAAAVQREERIPLYAKVFEHEAENLWCNYVVQWPSGWTTQGNVEGFELHEFNGWPNGYGFKYLWFNDV